MLQPPLPFDANAALDHLALSDPALAELIGRVGPLELKLRPIASPFAALARIIIYQQLSGKAASTIFGRVLDLVGGPAYFDAEAAAALHDDDLRSAGVSRPKLRALRDLVEHSLRGEIPDADVLRGMDIEELYRVLTRVKGVGKWSVDMMAIFWLGHPDVLPLNDLGIRKGFQLVFSLDDLPGPEAMLERAEPWRPYRSVASWYLWRAVDTVVP